MLERCAIVLMLAVLCGLAPAPLSAAPVPKGYVVFQSVPLDPGWNGIVGSVQILQDERVSDELREGWGNSNDPMMVLGEDDPLLASIKRQPLRDGRVRVLDAAGKPLLDEPLGVALGRIDVAHLYEDGFPTYLIASDFGVGAGSYAGPATMLLEIRGGKPSFAAAAGETGRIRLGSSLKNAWKIVPAAIGKGQEIEQVQCHPAFGQSAGPNEDVAFVVEYISYRFDGRAWRRASRQEPGYFESDGDAWPDRAKFP